MYKLQQDHRSFWITVLHNERLIRPIACPFHEDLSRHDLRSLKQFALHSLRLQRNWCLPRPRIIGPIKAVSLGLPLLDVIFQVPGTELYLFHSRTTGTLEVWDIGLGKRVTQQEYVSSRIADVSPGEDLLGTFSMGLLTSDPEGLSVSHISPMTRTAAD